MPSPPWTSTYSLRSEGSRFRALQGSPEQDVLWDGGGQAAHEDLGEGSGHHGEVPLVLVLIAG